MTAAQGPADPYAAPKVPAVQTTSFWRYPVPRRHGYRYVLVVLVAFASTVIVTRWLLDLAGYPKLAAGDLHVAHALWGGLLLYAAALLPLAMAGRTAYLISALLSGVGMGLFIDEVGKFITERNDYFYPVAAPLIYASFMISVFAWLQIRRRRPGDAKGHLLSALEGLEEAVVGDLQRTERRELLEELERARSGGETEAQRLLASAMHRYLASEASTAARRRTAWDAVRLGWLRRRRRWIGGRGVRAVVGSALFLAGVNAIAVLVLTLIAMAHGFRPEETAPLVWRLAHLVAEGVAGSMLLAGAVLSLSGRRESGFRFAFRGLIVALTLADVLAFYIQQFESISTALFHVALLLVVSTSRSRRAPERGLETSPA